MRPEAVLISGTCDTARAIARHYSARGTAVAVFGENSSALREAASGPHNDGPSIAIEGRAGVEADVLNAVTKTLEAFGGLTSAIIVPAVGAANENGNDGNWTATVTTTLAGVVNLAKVVLPHLIESNGSLVAVTPLAGVCGVVGQSATATAMHGVVGFVRTLALDYGPQGVRSNVVCYGALQGRNHGRTSLQRIPMRRAGHLDEVASAVAHLTSPRASYTNGTVQIVDGGLTAGYLEVDEEPQLQ